MCMCICTVYSKVCQRVHFVYTSLNCSFHSAEQAYIKLQVRDLLHWRYFSGVSLFKVLDYFICYRIHNDVTVHLLCIVYMYVQIF